MRSASALPVSTREARTESRADGPGGDVDGVAAGRAENGDAAMGRGEMDAAEKGDADG